MEWLRVKLDLCGWNTIENKEKITSEAFNLDSLLINAS